MFGYPDTSEGHARRQIRPYGNLPALFLPLHLRRITGGFILSDRFIRQHQPGRRRPGTPAHGIRLHFATDGQRCASISNASPLGSANPTGEPRTFRRSRTIPDHAHHCAVSGVMPRLRRPPTPLIDMRTTQPGTHRATRGVSPLDQPRFNRSHSVINSAKTLAIAAGRPGRHVTTNVTPRHA